MPRTILLGTGSAWSGADRENTYMLVQGEHTNILIDCAGSPAQRLARIGLSPAQVDKVILTHNHPDHIYGWPIFALNAWMAGRTEPLDVYGLPNTIIAARGLLRVVEAKRWPHFFRIRYHEIVSQSIDLILTDDEFTISGTMAQHFVPTLSVRVISRATGEGFAYSADTTPQENFVEFARGIRYLLHEATTLVNTSEGHSSAIEAGRQASLAQVRELVLIHLPPDVNPREWRDAARQEYSGPIRVAADMDEFDF